MPHRATTAVAAVEVARLVRSACCTSGRSSVRHRVWAESWRVRWNSGKRTSASPTSPPQSATRWNAGAARRWRQTTDQVKTRGMKLSKA